jgi:hypothetical protein
MTAKRKRNPSKSQLKRVVSFIWSGSRWRKALVIFIALFLLVYAQIYIVAAWYKHRHADEPLILGTTFISDYAQSFGLEPETTLKAIFEELGIRHVRLVSYWKEVEATPGQYDFSELDWQFDMAEKYGADVTLAIGLRQPRWPECHEPKWADISAPEENWKPQLYDYMTAVVNRYKDRPSLISYQLENEFFMKVFGECKNFSRDRLVEEFEMVKRLDPNHTVIISRSNNWYGLPLREPTPDRFGISVYKRVWDSAFTHRYYEYPLPAEFYGMLAGWGEIFTGKDMVIHELQAEAWAPQKYTLPELSVEEQYKSMNPQRMKDRISYGIDTGLREMNLWGAEWWYWLKSEKNEPGIWNVVKEEVQKANQSNTEL